MHVAGSVVDCERTQTIVTAVRVSLIRQKQVGIYVILPPECTIITMSHANDIRICRNDLRSGIDVPEGQCTHVLRHTFASHFMMNGGNILILKEILGHTDIKMTMIYAHFAPEHLEDAVTKNPLFELDK